MVEYLVTKGKLVVRNNEPLVVVDGDEKALLNPNDISNVKYISTGKSIDTKSVNVMCFDFQYECIRKYVGDSDNVEYYTYDSVWIIIIPRP